MTSPIPPVRLLDDEDLNLGPARAGRELAEDATDSVKLPGHEIRVSLEDGSSWVVRVDNRDFIRWDKTAPRQKWSAETQPFLFQTFLAWAASVRRGLTSLKFEEFQAAALETTDVAREAAREDAEAEDAVRPTR